MRTWLRLPLALALPAVALQGADWLEQFWPEAKIYIKTSQTSRIYLQWAATRTSADGYTDGQLGAYTDFYFAPLLKGRVQRHPDAARSKMLMIRAGYYYAKTPSDSKDPWTEHTAVIETTPRFFLPKLILVENRLRGDLRFVSGEFRPRFRDRLRIERTFQLKRTAITPYGEFETFYDWRYNSFHRQRYDAGAEWILTRHFILEGYYLREQDSQRSPKGIDVAGMVLQFYFP